MSEEITNDQLEAMSGGELLRQEVCSNNGLYRQSQKFLVQKSQNGVLNKRILNFVYNVHPLLPSSQIHCSYIEVVYLLLWICLRNFNFHFSTLVYLVCFQQNFQKIVPTFVFNQETFFATLPFDSLIHFIILQWTEKWLLYDES